jgi:hypothetical protein
MKASEMGGISDELSPIQHHLVLHRIDLEDGIAQFYSL